MRLRIFWVGEIASSVLVDGVKNEKNLKVVAKSEEQNEAETTDCQLIKLFSRGSNEAFEELVKRYETKVFNLSMSFTRNVEDAEEVLQDVFLTVYRKVEGFEGKSAFSSWLYRITVNASFMKLRKRKQSQAISIEEVTPVLEKSWQESEEAPNQRSDALAINNQLKDTLTRAIHKLPEEYRLVFMLRDVDGLSNKEVGEMLKISIPAVKSRLHRSRLMLRKKLSRFYDDYQDTTQVLAPGLELLRKAV